MAKHNVPMDLMKVTRNAASRNTLSITTKSVAANKINSNVVTVTASTRVIFVTVKPSAQMVLTKVMLIAALENSHSITTKNVAAKMMNGNVTMVIASS